MLLGTRLCSGYFNSGYKRRMIIRRRTHILDKLCFNYEQFFHPIQSTACKTNQCTSKDNLVLAGVTAILSFQVNCIIFEVQIALIPVHDKIDIACISLELYTYFSSTFLYCPIQARSFFFAISLSNIWQWLHLN